MGFFDDLRHDAAAAVLAAIYPGNEAPVFSLQAAQLLEPFSADERTIIGAKAIELGANPQSISQTIHALNFGGASQGSEVVVVAGKLPGPPWWLLALGLGVVGIGALAYRKYKKRR
jgi:hypothetical protein